ncbi:helix-turn-helix domain-containing protein [Vibrio fluvialis]|uniref:helix-turn-helix transcriptional regulator n=1 Tax=Vibrio fluvialis TaxID=676 RepID=UPI001F313707|nr:helix-turn-helix transcriptional regulator [Vibrio fluvialis]MCE7612016.1 helix-turn-helix domain-containing protein [Vibrio fluvialis]MCE7617588.1 helix-turn-helix domain-containing protein [Vibrio fluvialis]MCE7626516.1 helix-turn-helix domain-containing protein [Vibrio fluvialis]
MSNIRQIRLSLCISQETLAAQVGVTQGAIAHFEAGKRTPNINMCWKIVEALSYMGAQCCFEDVFPNTEDNISSSQCQAKPPIKGANGE